MAITWLADVLRAAGVTVVEHSGWRTHDRPGTWDPRFLVIHATAAPSTQSDETQVRIVRDGRSDLRGPIANACVDRQGRWHVLSAGRCNTTLAGTAGPYDGLGNSHALGIEACNDNGLHSPGETWPAVQYDAYVRGVAAICKRLKWGASRARGHKEHTPGRKSDPTFSMTRFRADVGAALAGTFEEDDMPTVTEIWAAEFGPASNRKTAGELLAESRAAAVAAQTAVTSGAAAEATRDAQQSAQLAQLLVAVQTLAARTGGFTEQQMAAVLAEMRSAAQQAGADAAARVVEKVDSLREHLGDDAPI